MRSSSGCSNALLKRSSISLGVALALSSAAPVFAQDDLEEIIVTGSFIRNSDFTGASPVDTVDQETLLTYGAANIGQYIRDLTYTQNVDTVANVLGGAGGGQDSNSAQFNLRGLGVSSTLTLLDGRRNINDAAISSILPDIATDRIEVVLDGGSALYGSDAVAGVVNLIPIKEYEGLRVRSFYLRDQNADFEEPKLGVLWGHDFGNGLNMVAALEIGRKTPLNRGERPEFLRVDNATFIGAPGHYQLSNGAPYLDPDCGAYNEGLEDKGIDGSFPSGFPIAGGLLCGFHYAQWTDYNRNANDYVSYINTRYEASDAVTLEFQAAVSYRESIFHTEPVTPLASAWYDQFTIPPEHPANPTGLAVRPGVFGIGTYTVWNGLEQGVGSKPSYLGESSFQEDRYQYTTEVYKFGAEFEISETWVGEAWFGYQSYEQRVDTYDGNAFRLIEALNGRGGPNGDEWFNPFNSRDIRSQFYDADRSDGRWTNNTQEVVDWLFESGDHNLQEDRLIIFDAIVTGDLFELPTGTVGS
ncbi:MAG: TonB-dependent receptor plug domain-containing protein, partial [Pseudomonadales bacterium]|nr:TonB-dependent receptor plug domain-containing protein [Pseudomonadales bacterium]